MPIISSGNVTVEGTLTAEEYVVSSSVTNQTIAQASSSTEFGDDSADTHVFTGSLFISGGLNLEQGNATFAGSQTIYADGNVALAATKGIFFDGGTHTSIAESSGDNLRFQIGGSKY